MKQSSSNRRVNEQAREVISEILLFEISDPRLDMVTITGVEVSYDRSVANVYYSTEPSRYTEVAQAFNAAAGRIRSLMAGVLHLNCAFTWMRAWITRSASLKLSVLMLPAMRALVLKIPRKAKLCSRRSRIPRSRRSHVS